MTFSSISKLSLLFTGCWGLSCISYAQSPEALDTLIFDAFLLNDSASPSLSSSTVTGRAIESVGLLSPSSNSFVIIEDEELEGLQEQTQLALPENLLEDITDYQESISDLERREGPFSPELTQVLFVLGTLYQTVDQHDLAVVMFERADHISRINNGLYHQEQVSVIEQLIESYLALDDFSAASDRQRYLLFLNSKMSEVDDFSMAQSLSGLGDGNMKRFVQALLEKEVTQTGLKINFLPSLSGIPDV